MATRLTSSTTPAGHATGAIARLADNASPSTCLLTPTWQLPVTVGNVTGDTARTTTTKPACRYTCRPTLIWTFPATSGNAIAAISSTSSGARRRTFPADGRLRLSTIDRRIDAYQGS